MGAMLRPKNWASFQHYKDRAPPWIKLHRALLDDYDFACLPLASKALAPLLWLLAAESTDGHFTGEVSRLAHRLRWSDRDMLDGLKPLIDKGFFEVASGVLAECLQLAIPETETETEAEREKATVRQVAQRVAKPVSRFDDFWSVYPNKQGKQKAQERWQRDKLDGMADSIIRHVCLMTQTDDGWQRGYAPMGSTYLNQARWTDVPRAAPQQASQQPGKQMQGLMALEGMKNGLVPSRNHHGHSEIGSAGLGSAAIGRGFTGDGFGVAGSAGQRRALGHGNGRAEDSRGVLDLGADSYFVAESAADD